MEAPFPTFVTRELRSGSLTFGQPPMAHLRHDLHWGWGDHPFFQSLLHHGDTVGCHRLLNRFRSLGPPLA